MSSLSGTRQPREGTSQNASDAVEMNELSEAQPLKRSYGGTADNHAIDDEPVDLVVDAENPDGRASGFRGKLEYIFFEKEPLLCRITKWVFVTLLALFLLAIVVGIFYSGFRTPTCNSTTNTTDNTTTSCETSFGQILGGHNGVLGFSNCNSVYVSMDMYAIPLAVRAANGTLTSQPVFAGMKWQCVEYARRYWMLAGTPEPAIFGDVDGAADIWDLTEVTAVRDMTTKRPLYAFPNGASILAGGAMPEAGDIIIYPRQRGDEFPAGHVAVIVKVELPYEVATEAGRVYVAEQNWDSYEWQAPFYNYTRTIPITYDNKEFSYTISDPYGDITGWMRYG